MQKTQLNMRVDSVALDVFKSQAEARGLSQVEYFELISKDSTEGKTLEFLSSRLEGKDEEIKNLESVIKRYEKQTGKKITDTRKVTFLVTQKQFDQISLMAHKLQIPKNQLMSKLFLNKSEYRTPMLETNDN